MARASTVDYEPFWVVPRRPVATWQTERYRYDFGGANPGPDVMPLAELAEAARAVILEEGDALTRYPPTYGPERLRHLIVRKMRDHRRIAWPTAEDVLATNGSAQGIILALETLVRPGDTVVADRFFYQGAVRQFKGVGATVATVDRDDDGMRMDLLEETLRSLRQRGVRPKFIYTIPSPQNPEGTVMPLARRRRMLALSHEFDTLVLEDDCYVDQALDVDAMPPAIASLDGAQERVIYVATFSKIISPSVRVGWVTATPPLLERMAAYKQDVGNDYLSGLIVAKFLEERMDERIAWLNARLRQKRDAMLAALREGFGPTVEVRVPAGGMFLWARFPEGTDMLALEPKAPERGVRYLSGPNFSPIGEGHRYARLNYSFPTPQEIEEGIAALVRTLREEGALPA